ncbi:hypothetical protein WAI453_000760 [Rhynchosporium graminicola]|uniref:Uncharacterized protein n=2 Tax=Rhynchosporium TaxID=38037 RepID=A0A1E1MK57_RHYSE|nr:uncharacterized protein RCO7_14259 [Rhynchosporium commune]CZT49447.1 uncharacterized protein RSE6_10298 [Rhynchosporium secalis]
MKRMPEPRRRSNSWGSSSNSSTDTADTELRDWTYTNGSGNRNSDAGEQDEVQRKRREGRRVRDKIAERTWREFWG